MSVIEIKEKEFDLKVKESKNKVLVDCYADWCGPCRMLSPVIDELSLEIDNCDFYKLNIDDADEVAKKYGIMSIPTILIFENNELKDKVVGFRTKEELSDILGNNSTND